MDAVSQEIYERDALKAVCEKAGMTESENQSLFLPKEHMRDIFNLARIVRLAILANGTVVGWRNLKNRKLKVTIFSPANQKLVEYTASRLWSDLMQNKHSVLMEIEVFLNTLPALTVTISQEKSRNYFPAFL